MIDNNAAIKCIDYILSHEFDDFKENPSTNHIYFHALVAAYGIGIAMIDLNVIKNKGE